MKYVTCHYNKKYNNNSIKFVFNTFYIHLVSHVKQGTVYSLIICVYEHTFVEWPHTSDE